MKNFDITPHLPRYGTSLTCGAEGPRMSTLADFLKLPEPPGAPLCGQWVAEWLAMAGIADVRHLLTRHDMVKALAEGSEMDLARRVLAHAGFIDVADPVGGMPVVAVGPLGDTVGIWTGSLVAAIDGEKVVLGRWPVLAAWAAPGSVHAARLPPVAIDIGDDVSALDMNSGHPTVLQ